MSRNIKERWNIVLSGYPNSGKTILAKRLVADYQCFARVNVDALREMLFNETPPSRDEYAVYSLVAQTRDALLKLGYSPVIDSTAPDNVTREFLLSTRISPINELLIILNVNRQTLTKRSIQRNGNTDRILAWDKRWEQPKKEYNLLKFNSNNMKEFEESYAILTELLESETHPFKPEFRPRLFPLNEIRKRLKQFLT
jgi:predicted kinase